MTRRAVYLSHPEVVIDPQVPVDRWGLSDLGRARVAALAASGALGPVTTVFSSTETKAIETAAPLAQALGADLRVDPKMGENDRSATGYLPEPEFQATADAFFAAPDQSIRGWETARAAQARIVDAVRRAVAKTRGDLLFCGHGAVGTLLYCHLAGLPIARAHDQARGGSTFGFDLPDGPALGPWQPMDALMAI